ncbi:MAG: PEP-CTERM sorting domain-containing protein [Verrucomicrobiaceae bacterium]|nr:PEP-CTERM sorting domain-containing protein [Verrucomicrobiaceae bacterium]
MRSLFSLSFLVAACVWMAPVMSSAVVLYSSTSSPTGFGPQLYFTTSRRAVDFETGADASTVTGLTIGLRNQDTVTRTAFAEIWSDNAGVPGALVGAFDTFQTLLAGQVGAGFSFLDAGIPLAALTKYWLVMSSGEDYTVSGNDLRLFYTLSSGDDGGNPFTSVTATAPQFSSNSGASWGNDTGYGNLVYTLTGTLDPVPEPSRALLLVAGVVVAGLRRRR